METKQILFVVGIFVLTWFGLLASTYIIGKPSKREKIMLSAMGICVVALVVVAIKLI